MSGLLRHSSIAVRVSTGTVAFLYLIGIVTIFRSSSEYGIANLNLLRLQYLAAGFWVAFPVVAPLTLLLLLIHVSERWKDHSRLPDYVIKLLHKSVSADNMAFLGRLILSLKVIIVLVVATWSIRSLLSGIIIPGLAFAGSSFIDEGLPQEYSSLLSFASVLSFIICWCVAVRRPSQVLLPVRDFRKHPYYRELMSFGYLVTFMIGFIWFVFGGPEFYSLIPAFAGGGHPITVRVVLKPESRLGDLLTPADSSTVQRDTFQLLFETDKYVTLKRIALDSPIVIVSKDIVAAMLIIGNAPSIRVQDSSHVAE